MSRRYLDIAVHPEQDEEVVGLGELLVHVADEEDAALAAAAPGVFPQRGLGDGLGLHLGSASSNTTCNSHFSSTCEINSNILDCWYDSSILKEQGENFTCTRVASDGSEAGELTRRAELVGKVGEAERGEGRAEHAGALLEGEGARAVDTVQAGVPGGQRGVGVVAGLVVVVLHVQVTQLGVLYPQGAAVVVDVLPVQRELGRLRRDHVWVLYQGLQQAPRHSGLQCRLSSSKNSRLTLPEMCCSL